MYAVDHDLFTLRKERKKEEFENTFRSAYVSYMTGGNLNSEINFFRLAFSLELPDNLFRKKP
jgi:hypothetical protein